MPERLCPRCNTRALEKYRRYCDECRDGQPPPTAVVRGTAGNATPVVAAPVQVIPVLAKVEARDVILSCKCIVNSSTLWQEMDYHCAKHGDQWVAKISLA